MSLRMLLKFHKNNKSLFFCQTLTFANKLNLERLHRCQSVSSFPFSSRPRFVDVCGSLVLSPVHYCSPGWCSERRFYVGSRRYSKGAKVCRSCRAWKMLRNDSDSQFDLRSKNVSSACQLERDCMIYTYVGFLRVTQYLTHISIWKRIFFLQSLRAFSILVFHLLLR